MAISFEEYKKRKKPLTFEEYREKTQPISFEEYKQKEPGVEENVLPGVIGTVFDVLQRPQYVSANVVENILDSITGKQEFSISDLLGDIGRGLTGEDKGSFIDITTEYLPESVPQWVKSGLGFAGDVILDPLNLLGVGILDDIGKVASKVDDAIKIVKTTSNISDISKLDDPVKAILKAGKIAEDSKLGKQVIDIANKHGVEALELGTTAAEQAAKGQRGLLTFAGKSVLPSEVSEGAFKGLSRVGDTIKGTEPYQAIASKLSTKHGVPDELLDMEKLRDRRLNIRKQEVIEKGKGYEDLVKNLGIDRDNITDLIEKGENISDSQVSDLINLFRKENEEVLRLEQLAGVPIQKLQDDSLNYFAHMITEEAREKILKKHKWKDKTIIQDILNRIEHGSTVGREYRGKTIKEINELAREGKLSGYEDVKFNKFFEDDPVIVQSLRNLRSARARTSAEFLQEVGQKFGNVEKGMDISQKVHVYNPQLSSILKGYKFDPEIADYLLDYVKKTTPEGMQYFSNMFDKVQNFWKRTTLMPIPGFHVRNAFDNTWKNYLGDVDIGSYSDWIRLRNAGNITTEAGKKITAESFDKLAKEYGVIDTGFLMSNVGEALEKELRKGNTLLSKTGEVLREAGAFNENTFRQIHFLDKLKKGYGPQKAADSVSKYLFNYNDLTHFEKTFMKRLMPFYTFTRKNIPLQLEKLVTEPGKLTKIPKGIAAVDTLTEAPDETYLPDWIKDSANVRVPFDEDPSYFLLDNWISSVDLLNLSSPEEIGTTAINLLSPFIKTPVELATNFDLFKREPISEYEGETTDYLGMPVDNELLKIIQSMVPGGRLLSEIDRANPLNVFGDDQERPFQGTGAERAIRALTGLRSYNYDPEVSAFFQHLERRQTFQDMLNDYKKAQDRGDTKTEKRLEELLRQFLEQNP